MNKSADEIVIFQGKDGAIELRGDISHETVWATQAQMAEVFSVNPQAVTRHIKNIYKEDELLEKGTCSKLEQVQKEGRRTVRRQVLMYNLDVMIAVGYRINSVTGTRFRKWATKILKTHLLEGYTINRPRIKDNYDAFMKAVSDVQEVLPEHVTLDPKAILDLVKEYAVTWVSLDAYDKEELTSVGATRRSVKLSSEELLEAIETLRNELMRKKEATELFANERSRGSVEGIIGNVMQSFGGKPVYKTAEEKAAHLLYFFVKNHPFTDGNKRSGAFAFLWFLRKAKVKKMRNMNPAALTALTLLVAESNPKDKEQIVALITQLLK